MKILLKIIKYILREYRIYKSSWKGDYLNWEKALEKTSSYNSEEIFEQVRVATLNVKNGIYPYERDSVNFDKIEYSYPLLIALLSAVENEELIVFDFGGALGSSYFQNREFLFQSGKVKTLKWCVIEQERFVNIGNKEIKDDCLFFFESINKAIENVGKPQIILLSSVLPYVSKPYSVIAEVISTKAKFICVDRTYFFDKNSDRIAVQKVPKDIYEADYPSWILNYKKIIQSFDKNYNILLEFDGYIPLNIYFRDEVAKSRGFICKIREN